RSDAASRCRQHRGPRAGGAAMKLAYYATATPGAGPAGTPVAAPRRRSVLPGFGLGLGFTLTYLSLLVLIPLAGLVLHAAGYGIDAIWRELRSERVGHALALSFGGALLAAAINTVIGSLVAWTFVRYRFPGKALFHALVDLPFALPTAVAGIALTTLY